MQYRSLFRILGILIALFSLTMIPPAIVGFIYDDGGQREFLLAFIYLLILGFIIWYPNQKERHELKVREGFLLVVSFWVVLGLVGSLPFFIAKTPAVSVIDAIFESFSGLTSTGTTVFSGLEYMPKSVLFYRQLLQWLGGMGIIVLAVAILPMLGVGGMQLYKAETPGPVKDSKMTPRIADTAKHLWSVYFFLTIACAFSFYLAGMNLFDAISHSFSTVSLGGFSTYDASFAHFDNNLIYLIASFFLLVSGFNFALHFVFWQKKSFFIYFKESESRVYLIIILSLIAICFVTLALRQHHQNINDSLVHAIFQSLSIILTAGFTSDSFSSWPLFLPILLIFASFIGGCAGSTSGGMKVIRIFLLYLQGTRELKRLIHSKAIYPIKMGNRLMPAKVIDAIWGFFAAYTLVFIVCMLGVMATGVDALTSFSAVAASLNNMGVGIAEISSNSGSLPSFAKIILIVAMLFGRLEIFTLLVLFSKYFWVK